MTRSMSIVTILALFGSLFLALAPVAAQDAPSAGGGITVTGYGMASAPAESAQLEFLIADQNELYGGMASVPEVEATPGAMARESVGPIEAAIAAYEGVESVEVVVPLFTEPYGPPAAVARILVNVAAPEGDHLAGLVSEVVQVAAADRLLVSYVGAMFETADCATLEGDARQAAFEDAQGQAESQAAVLGVSLGEVVGSSDVEATDSVYGPPSELGSNCDPASGAFVSAFYQVGASLPPFDPTIDAGQVEVHRQVQVTFAIDGAEATPAS